MAVVVVVRRLPSLHCHPVLPRAANALTVLNYTRAHNEPSRRSHTKKLGTRAFSWLKAPTSIYDEYMMMTFLTFLHSLWHHIGIEVLLF